MKLFVALVCGLQPLPVTKNSILGVAGVFGPPLKLAWRVLNLWKSSNEVKLQDYWKCKQTLSVTAFLSSYLIFRNCKYPKALTSPHLEHLTFFSVTPHLPHLHHLVTLWLFLYFSRVLGISCSSLKQTSFAFKLIGSYWNPFETSLQKKLLFIPNKL